MHWVRIVMFLLNSKKSFELWQDQQLQNMTDEKKGIDELFLLLNEKKIYCMKRVECYKRKSVIFDRFRNKKWAFVDTITGTFP